MFQCFSGNAFTDEETSHENHSNNGEQSIVHFLGKKEPAKQQSSSEPENNFEIFLYPILLKWYDWDEQVSGQGPKQIKIVAAGIMIGSEPHKKDHYSKNAADEEKYFIKNV